MNPGPNVSTTQNLVPIQGSTDASGNINKLVSQGGVEVPYTAYPSGLAKLSTDANGNVIGLGTIPLYGVAQSGLTKHWGNAALVNNSALVQTRLLKITAEAPFDAVRVHHYHYGSTTVQWKFAVAATETADTGTQANICNPIVNSTSYNVIDSTADAYGWKTATFAGAATKTCAGTGLASPTYLPEIITSDWVTCPSVARADGGTLPLLMVMGFPINAATQSASWLTAANLAVMATSTAANRGRILQNWRNGSDAIATPGAGTFSAQTDSMPFAVEFRYRNPATCIMFIGDSITQNNGLLADNISSWGYRTCADLSSPLHPVTSINEGSSSCTSLIYWTAGKALLTSILPKVAVYQVFSPNDTPYTTDALTRYSISNQMSRTLDFIDTCRKNNVRPVLCTGLPSFSNMGATQDTLRKAYLANIRTIATNANIGLLDFDTLFTDGASPANIKSPYNNGDNIHFNELGIELAAQYCTTILKNYI